MVKVIPKLPTHHLKNLQNIKFETKAKPGIASSLYDTFVQKPVQAAV